MYTENNVKKPSKIAIILDGLLKSISKSIYSHLVAAIVPALLVFLGAIFVGTRNISSFPGELNAQRIVNEQQNIMLQQIQKYIQNQDLINAQQKLINEHVVKSLSDIKTQLNTLIAKI